MARAGSSASGAGSKEIFLSAQRKAKTNEPIPEDIFNIGTIGTIIQLLRLPDGTVKVLVEGKRRASIRRFVQTDAFFTVEVDEIPEVHERSVELDALVREVHATFETYVKLNKRIAPEILISVQTIEDPGQLADTMVGQLQLKLADKQAILEIDSPSKRLSRLYELIKAEIEILQVERKIRTRVKKQMEKTQKEYYLNEQMQAIQKELGDRDEFKNELTELEERAKQKNLSKEAHGQGQEGAQEAAHDGAHVRRGGGGAQLRRLGAGPALGREDRGASWTSSTPSGSSTRTTTACKKVKERILEYLAVQALVKKLQGPILCLVGPPGVGKTSLARSIAKATGRNFVRLSLGGVRDEAEIRGHRRTYIGALPGKIIQSLKKAGSPEPGVPARRGRQDVDRLPRRSLGGAARGAGPRAERHLQRPLPRPRLRPVGRHVHHDGQLPARDPDAAAGPHGDHPAPRLHRVREVSIAERYLIPKQKKDNGIADVAGRVPRGRGPRRHPPLHEGGGRPEPGARDRHRLPQDRARRRRQEGAGAHARRRRDAGWQVTPKRLPRYLGPHRFRYGRSGRRGRDRSRQRPGRDDVRRRSAGHRGVDRRGQGQAGADRQAGRRHAGVGAGGDQLRPRPRAPSLGLDRDFYSARRHPRAPARRRHPQGRPLGGDHHVHRPGLGAAARAGAAATWP